ncbi:hypothetical protein ACIBEA_41605 [Streptomyces sp. NPDC051555]|uniref:hypothetical protein n=1 Tax=Streptomyces sp. NPDC051555 TaxID=3365657 RepID=UPI0037AA8F9B
MDERPWAAALADFGFTVLDAAQLLSPAAEVDTAALAAAEHRQVKHWNPKTLGAMLFNSWD